MPTARLSLLRQSAAARRPPWALPTGSALWAARLASTDTLTKPTKKPPKSGTPSVSPLPTPKQRRLLPPSPIGSADEHSIKEATAWLELRKMPIVKSDFDWLRKSRSRLAEIFFEKDELYKAQKRTTVRMAEIANQQKAAAAAAKKPTAKAKAKAKGKGKAAQSDASKEAESAKPDDPSSTATATETEPKASAAASTTETIPAAAPDSSVHESSPANAVSDEELAFIRKEAKRIKDEIAKLSEAQEQIVERSLAIRLAWPNGFHPDVPVGPEAKAIVVNVEDPAELLSPSFDAIKQSWNRSVLQLEDFVKGPGPDARRDHLRVASMLDDGRIDMAAGTLSTGSSWPYLLGSISLLEHAISQYALAIAVRRGFLPVTPPDVIRADLADRCGFRPRDEKAKQTYFLETDKPSNGKAADPSSSAANELCLAATAEIPLAALVAGLTFPGSGPSRRTEDPSNLLARERLPLKMIALGHAFRAEAGARGTDTRGLYRVHQFTKAEMFVVTEAEGEESNTALEELREIQEEIIGGLDLPFRVLDMPTQELGASAYRKYDVEAWMPGRGSWGEVSSASNCTDYQARRLMIRYQRSSDSGVGSQQGNNGEKVKDEGKGMAFAHTLNATAAAIPRLVVALLENHGTKEGKLVLPLTLKPYWLGGPNDGKVEWISRGARGTDASPEALTDSAAASAEAKGSGSPLQWALEKVRERARQSGTDPASMVASFLLLHEITALVPLVALFYLLSALGAGEAVLEWLQGDDEKGRTYAGGVEEAGRWNSFVAGYVRDWIQEGMRRAEKYGRAKGYFGFEKEPNRGADPVDAAGTAMAQQGGGPNEAAASLQGMKLAGSFANAVAAYALVKALAPLRIGASIALAGPFSRLAIEPLKRMARKLMARRAERRAGRS